MAVGHALRVVSRALDESHHASSRPSLSRVVWLSPARWLPMWLPGPLATGRQPTAHRLAKSSIERMPLMPFLTATHPAVGSVWDPLPYRDVLGSTQSGWWLSIGCSSMK